MICMDFMGWGGATLGCLCKQGHSLLSSQCGPVEVQWRQCGPVVRTLALRSRDPEFKSCSDHSLNLFLVVPGSTSQLHL